MKLSQTFGIGAGLAVFPLVAGLAFTVDRLQDLASQSERLMLRQLTAVRLGTDVVTRLDRLAEYQTKFMVSQDEGYARKATQVSAAIDAEVAGLATADLGTTEDAALAAFIERWRRHRASPARGNAAIDEVEALAGEARELLRNAHEAAVEDVAKATQSRVQAWRAAITATVIALLSSVSVLAFVLRRIRRRLDDFVDASVAVSRGAFSAQLPEDGDDELGRVASAFNQMVTALAQLERLKADFISSISHELRTPLVAMVETNEALLDDVAGALTDQQRRMITLNRGAAQRLSVMIGDLLELSVVRSGLRYRMASTTLDGVVSDAASELEARAADHGLTLHVKLADHGVRVNADRDRLLQVVQNLVANAIKFTPAGGTVEVTLKLADRATVSGNGARPVEALRYGLVCVDDTGPGIPVHDRERVFEKFFRRQGVSADGVGLGLAICREIVLAHRGIIWIEDGRLGGATMCVAIPVELA